MVLVAAGRGERLGSGDPKQFRLIAGVPMLLRALRPFLSHPDVASVVVVLPPDILRAPPGWLTELTGDRLQLVAGGAVRMDSAELGVRALSASISVVLVHDAARPFPGRDTIDAVIGAARTGRGAIAAVPLRDTVKESSAGPGEAPTILRTVPRERLWRAQTPQGFPRVLLEHAFSEARLAGFEGTDEASLVERLGTEVVLIPDAATNLKVTTPDDLRLAELLAGAVP